MAHDRPHRGLRHAEGIATTAAAIALLLAGSWTSIAPAAALWALNVTVVGSGTVSKSPDLPSYGAGVVVTLTASPAPGYYFTGWSGDATGSVDPTSVTMSSDLNVTATFAPITDVVLAASPGGWIAPSTPSASIPIQISRTDSDPVMSFSVTFQLDHLVLGGSPNVVLGDFLAASGGTVSSPIVTDNGGGSYTVTASTVGSPCGSGASSGELFHVLVGSNDVAGAGTLTITSVTLSDCSSATIPSNIGAAAMVGIDATAPTVAVTAPNGGETWLVGASQNITWNATDAAGIAGDGIDLAYSSDGGTTWTPIASGLANTGSYAWTVAGPISAVALVRATARDVNGNSATDVSDAPFTIDAPTAVALTASPNPAVFGQPITLTATVSTVPPGLGAPSGTVTFKDGATVLAGVAIANGAASTSISSLAVGSHTLRASLPAGGLFAAGYSSPLTVAVQAQVTATSGTHGQISPTGAQLFNLNDTPSFTFTPDVGYHIAAVTVDGTPAPATSPYVFAPLAGNHTIDVQFAINRYTLATSGVGGGSVAAAPVQSDYAYGSLVTLQANPDVGHVFVGWSGDLSGNVNPIGVIMDANKSITATFTVSQYSLNVAVVGSGTVSASPDLPSYSHGTTVTLTANPAAGYHFVGWSGDTSGSSNPVTLTMDGNKSVTATFAINQYTLDVSVVGTGSVSKSPDLPTYAHGSLVSLQALPGAAQHFVGWSGDVTGSTNPTTLYMDAAKQVTATFAINQFPVAVTVVGNGTVARSPDQPLYDQGSSVTLTATPAVGYHFVGWSGDASGSSPITSVTVDAAKSVTATFAINQYPIAVNITGSGTVDQSPNQASYDYGTVVTLTATPATGYHFVGWSGDASGSSPTTSVTVDAAKNVTATFAINQYAIAVTISGNGTVTPSPNQPLYDYGTVVTLTAAPATGYHFVGWGGDASGSSPTTNVTVDGAKNVTATFAINQEPLTITIAGSGSVAQAPNQAAYDYGTVVTLTATPATGSHFVGWSGDTTASTAAIALAMTAPKSLTATFAPNQYAVTISVVGNGTAAKSPNQSTYAYGTSVTLTATPNFGNQFVGWTGSIVSSSNPVTITVDTVKAVTCTFLVNQYTLSTSVVGSGSITRSPDLASYAHGTVVALTAVPAVGYHFVSWSGALSGTTNPSNLTMNSNKSVTATFAINTYTLTVAAVGNGTVAASPVQATYNYGTSVTLTATPATGNYLSAWSGDLAGNANPATLIMNGNKSVTGTFAINTYTLAVTTVGSGTVSSSPNQATYNYGTSVTLTATPSTGYHFVSWSGDASGSLPSASVTFDANKAVTATFAINQYTLSVAVSGPGSVSKSPDQSTYAHRTAVTLAASPAAGNHLDSWSGDATGSANPTLLTMDSNKSVTANFTPNQLILTVNIAGHGSVVTNPSQSAYAPGSQVQLTATPALGNAFTGWSGDLSGTQNPGMINMDASHVVTANFTPNANPIAAENQLPGVPESQWDVGVNADPSILGFTTDMSVNRGQTVYFKVSTNAPSFHFDIYRVGYYQGNGARLVATVPGIPAIQPLPLVDYTTGLVDCGNWGVSGSWNVPATAVSGVYIAKVTRDDTHGASHIPFIVRDDSGTSDLLFQTSDATWQAYNSYGGNSLYGGSAPFPSGHAAKVSYNRPFTNRASGSGDNFFRAEYLMVRWLEANGYNVSYFSDIDSDRYGSLIPRHRVFMSVGHDEYWSAGQRANVSAARDGGTNLAFFSGNEIYWKTRWEPSIDGTSTPYRTLVCYKEGTLGERACGGKCDPAPGIWTGLWRDGCGSAYPVNDGCRPENELSGSLSWTGSSGPIYVPYEDRQLRLWRNSDVANLLPGQSTQLARYALGFEWDPEQVSTAYPASRITLSSTSLGGLTHHMELYRKGSSLVFSAGSIQWSWALDNDNGTIDNVAPAARQATANLLAEMGAVPGTPDPALIVPTPSGDLTPPVSTLIAPVPGSLVPAGQRVAISGTSVDDAGTVARVQVSTDGGITWGDAIGTTSWTYSWTPTTSGPAQIQVRATDDWGNLEATSPQAAVSVTGAVSYSCPCEVWTPASSPANPDGGDLAPAEVGLKFRAAAAGQIRGIRYFKSAANGGIHLGNLWNAGGARLGQASFSGETASGWQEATFPSPIPIAADSMYIASVFMPAGHFANDAGVFGAAGVDAGPLHVLGNGESGPNGVLTYSSSSTFPADGLGGANYWVDVDYNNAAAADTTPPAVVSFSPDSGSTGISNTGSVTATFSEALDPASVSNATFQLTGPGGAAVQTAVSWQATPRLAVLTPSVPLSFSTVYTATLKGGTTGARILDLTGNALASDKSWSFTTSDPPAAPADGGPGGPILVVAADVNPFGRYCSQLLRAEGFNEFTLKDLSLITPAVLAGYDVVLLGQTALSSAQATMFANFATGGGTLIAMRPDAKLDSTMGIATPTDTTSNGYIKVDGTTTAGAGITSLTLQYHGGADLYTLAGATSMATLYSDRATPTSHPAVTQRSVGSAGGLAIAFAYDLARSVIYTRQGNPQWTGQERDGIAPITPSDLFYGAASADPEPDWVDFQRIAVPQADEQIRLLANLLLLGDMHRMPLPRFWYLPSGKKAAIVMTGENHGGPGIASRFDQYQQQSPAGCSANDWQCICATAYQPLGSVLTPAQAALYQSEGFDVTLGVDVACSNPSSANLDSAYVYQLTQFEGAYPNIPHPETARTYCSPWGDWSGEAETEAANNTRMDTHYQFKPLAWVGDRPGLFTGSALPMRFARSDGSSIDCYQLAVELTEESGQTYPTTVDSLLTRALDSRGYYGVYGASLQLDGQASPASDAIVASATAFNVPIISASQLLTWTDARRASAFGSLTWDGSHLGFTVVAPATAAHMKGMLPLRVGNAALSVLTVGGAPATFSIDVIKGIAYAFFDAIPGSYVATYVSDTTPPSISNVLVSPSAAGNSVVITWQTNELADSRVDYGIADTTLTVTNSELSFSHALSVAGLIAGTTYSYRVTSLDPAGHPSTTPPYSQSAATFTTPPAPCVEDETEADFEAGSLQSSYVSATGNGEVILAPTLGTEFDVLPPIAAWQSFPVASSGTATVANGVLSVNGTRFTAEPTDGYGPGHSLEFNATFSTSRAQSIGFGGGGDLPPTDVFDIAPWAMLSTEAGEASLLSRTWTGGSFLDQLLSQPVLGSPHEYRIHWTATTVEFYIDGVLIQSQPVVISGPMRPAILDEGGAGTPLPVNWIRMTPYATSGAFVSRVFDGGGPTHWTNVRWAATVPATASLAIDVRSGDTPVPDGTWTAFTTLSSSGVAANLTGRYVQYRARLATTDPETTPILDNVGLACTSASNTTGADRGLPSITMARPPMPNPASREAAFEYAVGTDLAGGGPVPVALTIYDVQGRVVRSVIREPQRAGRYRAMWNVSDNEGRRTRAGVFYYRFTIGRFSRTGKVVVLQ